MTSAACTVVPIAISAIGIFNWTAAPALAYALYMATTHVMEPETTQVGLLHRISSIVSSELSLDEMLGEIIGITAQVTNCDACLVYLLDRQSGEIVLRASQVPHAAALGNLRMKMGEGVTGWVAEHKSVVALPANAGSDVRFKRFQTLIEDTYEAFLSVPLVSSGDVIGVINVHHRQEHRHTSDEIALLTFVGEQMGGAISKSMLADANARLFEEAQEMKRQLETRKVVERAKGILQQRYSLSEEDAYLRLRNESRRLRRPMKDLAEAIILAEELSRKNEAQAT
ncbi:MAG TPA: ANTAR domain-containing protein [Bryobacteraceae bacterium]|nr:ANTAR domain-containing protein [Bryobacteraceae bacterium]